MGVRLTGARGQVTKEYLWRCGRGTTVFPLMLPLPHSLPRDVYRGCVGAGRAAVQGGAGRFLLLVVASLYSHPHIFLYIYIYIFSHLFLYIYIYNRSPPTHSHSCFIAPLILIYFMDIYYYSQMLIFAIITYFQYPGRWMTFFFSLLKVSLYFCDWLRLGTRLVVEVHDPETFALVGQLQPKRAATGISVIVQVLVQALFLVLLFTFSAFFFLYEAHLAFLTSLTLSSACAHTLFLSFCHIRYGSRFPQQKC